jgi:hypothetical protein
MKRYFVLAALMAAWPLPRLATADDGNGPQSNHKAVVIISGSQSVTGEGDKGDSPSIISGTSAAKTDKGPDKSTEKKTRPQVKLETLNVGKVFTIGPDGKMRVVELHGELPKAVLDKLPKEIRERMLNGSVTAPGGTASGAKVKIVVVKDGQRHEFEQDLSGPDAVKGLPLGEILKRAGQDMPPEAMQALEAATQALKAEEAARKDAAKAYNKAIAAKAKAKSADDIAAKLDKILERLERVESDLKEIKEKQDNLKSPLPPGEG